jgi:Holliday junction resolvasome RuvABC endonuclease subunit
MSRVVGLDLSLTGTGIASIGEHGFDAIETIKTPKAKIEGHERLHRILNAVTGHTFGADLVVVEGPSFGSQGNALHQMGGLWWLVTHRLWSTSVPYIIATPSQVKKFATGSGTADKDRVIAETVRRWPRLDIRDNNQADALNLALIGKRFLGEPADDYPKTHTVVLDKIRETQEAA